jgi:TrmH family RNA methyltransferase
MKTLRSRDNAFVKQLIGLAHSARDRKKAGLTVLDGEHLVSAYCEAIGEPGALAIAESAMNEPGVRSLLERVDDRVVHVLDDKLIKEASSLESPARVLGVIATPQPRPTRNDADAVLVLEDVQDPGNVGSMLRSAAAAGVTEAVLSRTTAFAWSPKVLRGAQGAHFLLNIVEGVDVVEFIRQYPGQSIALTPAASRSLYDCDLTSPVAFLIGNEGAGLSAELLSVADTQVRIPMPGKMESLNAAASAAICLFEMSRQRHQP